MHRVSSPAHNPFATAAADDGVEPYVASPSQRGQQYSVPDGYRHHFERSWLLPSRAVLLALLGVAGTMLYLRSDRILPILMGTTTTRVVTVDHAASAVSATRPADALPIDFPAHLPPTGAGPGRVSGAGGTAIVKCVQADGTVLYQQHACSAAPQADRGAR